MKYFSTERDCVMSACRAETVSSPRSPYCYRTDLEEEVLDEIRPSPSEYLSVRDAVKKIVDLLEEAKQFLGIDYTVSVQGSFAKDTWLSGDVDVDVFLLFDKSYCLSITAVNRILSTLRGKVFSSYSVEYSYAQHPYIRVYVEPVWVEIVPGCKIEVGEKPLTAVDRTPFHTSYVKEHLEPWQRDEVRLLKKFMKGVGVYGAEIAVRGFSGYLVELLIATFGCFRRVLEAATSWKPPIYIAPPGTTLEQAHRLRHKYPDSIMFVPDPVDPGRNVAAAVSKRSLALFVLASTLYLKTPSKAFFFPPKPPSLPDKLLEKAGWRAKRIIVVILKSSKRVAEDIAWGIGWRVARRIASLLKNLGFTVADYSVYASPEAVWVLVEVEEEAKPPLVLHKGPPAWKKDNMARFVEKHSTAASVGPWVGEDGVLYVFKKPAHISPKEAIASRVKEWLPKSASGYSVSVYRLDEAVNEGLLSGDLVEKVYQFVVKAPPWLKPWEYS